MKPVVLLIIPAYNEAENLAGTVAEVLRYRENTALDFTLDYIVVNDGSTDETRALCRQRAIECIDLPFNLGIGGAVQTGYLFAREMDYDVAVQYDGDGQHDVAYLPALLEPILKGGRNLTVGSRFLRAGGRFRSTWSRRMGIRTLSAIIRLCTGLITTDPTSGFRAADRSVIAFLSEHYPVDYPEPDSLAEMAKRGYAISDVSVEMRPRQKGVSSISSLKSIYYMLKVSLAILCKGFIRRVKR